MQSAPVPAINFSEFIRGNKLDLANKGIIQTPEQVSQLVAFLKDHTELTEVDVSYNRIGDTGAKLLSDVSTIKKLNISHNDLTRKGTYALVENSHYVSLDLSYNQVGPKAIDLLGLNTSLSDLNLDSCGIDDLQVLKLSLHPSLTKLSIKGCPINDSIEQLVKNERLSVIADPKPQEKMDAIKNKLPQEKQAAEELENQKKLEENKKQQKKIDTLTEQFDATSDLIKTEFSATKIEHTDIKRCEILVQELKKIAADISTESKLKVANEAKQLENRLAEEKSKMDAIDKTKGKLDASYQSLTSALQTQIDTIKSKKETQEDENKKYDDMVLTLERASTASTNKINKLSGGIASKTSSLDESSSKLDQANSAYLTAEKKLNDLLTLSTTLQESMKPKPIKPMDRGWRTSATVKIEKKTDAQMALEVAEEKRKKQVMAALPKEIEKAKQEVEKASKVVAKISENNKILNDSLEQTKASLQVEQKTIRENDKHITRIREEKQKSLQVVPKLNAEVDQLTTKLKTNREIFRSEEEKSASVKNQIDDLQSKVDGIKLNNEIENEKLNSEISSLTKTLDKENKKLNKEAAQILTNIKEYIHLAYPDTKKIPEVMQKQLELIEHGGDQPAEILYNLKFVANDERKKPGSKHDEKAKAYFDLFDPNRAKSPTFNEVFGEIEITEAQAKSKVMKMNQFIEAGNLNITGAGYFGGARIEIEGKSGKIGVPTHAALQYKQTAEKDTSKINYVEAYIQNIRIGRFAAVNTKFQRSTNTQNYYMDHLAGHESKLDQRLNTQRQDETPVEKIKKTFKS